MPPEVAGGSEFGSDLPGLERGSGFAAFWEPIGYRRPPRCRIGRSHAPWNRCAVIRRTGWKRLGFEI